MAALSGAVLGPGCGTGASLGLRRRASGTLPTSISRSTLGASQGSFAAFLRRGIVGREPLRVNDAPSFRGSSSFGRSLRSLFRLGVRREAVDADTSSSQRSGQVVGPTTRMSSLVTALALRCEGRRRGSSESPAGVTTFLMDMAGEHLMIDHVDCRRATHLTVSVSFWRRGRDDCEGRDCMSRQWRVLWLSRRLVCNECEVR